MSTKSPTPIEIVTVPLESNVDSALIFKCHTYVGIIRDIESNGVDINLLCVEIGVWHYIKEKR